MANSRFSNLRRIDVFKAKTQTKEDLEEIKDDNSVRGRSAEDLVQIYDNQTQQHVGERAGIFLVFRTHCTNSAYLESQAKNLSIRVSH